MTPQERISLICKSKEKGNDLYGRYLDLKPYILEYSSDIVRLRNQEKSRYYLNQNELSTVDSQNAWYKRYIKIDDDIGWCIFDKKGSIIGTIRLYDIAHSGRSCEEGSFIIDENYAMTAPFALESKILVFDFAFEVLKIGKIINMTRVDNKNMNSIAKRMGFLIIKEVEKNGVVHNYCELEKENYKRADLENILRQWRVRVYDK